MIGRRLAHFEITAKLGEGGMGEVYRAEDSKLGRPVAIKVLPEEFTSHPERLARFQREARVLASLNHPNIAVIHQVEQEGSTRFLVMELVEGEDLAARLERGSIPVDEALSLARQLAEGLEAAHSVQVVHRDLKPANLKTTSRGVLKILDFGLAKMVARNDPSKPHRTDSPTLTQLTTYGTLLGTAAYMSPEQARGEAIDERTDIWGFGVILYEMLTGRAAFPGSTATDILAAVIGHEVDWNRLPDSTPWRVRELLQRCLEKDQRRRLHAIADARVELEKTLEHPDEPHPAAAEKPPPWSWRRLAPAGLVVTLALAAGFLLGRQPFQTRASHERPPLIQFQIGWNGASEGLRWADPDRSSIAISRDGRQVAFLARSEDGVRRIHLHALDEASTRVLAGTENAETPFFSPDGRWLGFFQRLKLKKMLIAGGPPLTISRASGRYGASWGPDDRIVFPVIDVSGLASVSAEEGTVDVVTVVDRDKGEISHRWPQHLPDGKTILFTIGSSGDWDEADIAIHSLETGETRVLIEGGTDARYSPTGHLVYGRGALLWVAPFDPHTLEVTGPSLPLLDGVAQSEASGAVHFDLSQNGSLVYAAGQLLEPNRRLVWVDRNGSVEPLGAPERRYYHPRLSPDGKSIAVAIDDVPPHVWLFDLPRGNLTRFTFEGYNRLPIWTSDGSRVAWASSRGSLPRIYWKAPDEESDAEPLTLEPKGIQIPSAWSPDDQVLLFSFMPADSVGQGDVWSLRIGEEPKPFVADEAGQVNADFSPDGRWVAYQSDESDRWEIYLRPFPGPGAKRQLSSEGGEAPVWSHDGREILYWSGEALMAIDVGLEPNLEIGSSRELLRLDFNTRYAVFRNYDLGRDGRLLMVQQLDKSPEIRALRAVINWPRLLDQDE